MQNIEIYSAPIICKKNSKEIRYGKKGKVWIGPSAKVEKQQKHLSQLFGLKLKPVSGMILLRIKVCFPDARRRDLDGTIASILDALVLAGIIEDDNWKCVPEIYIQGVYTPGESKTIIQLMEMTELQ